MNQDEIDKIIKEIDQADGNVQFIPIPPPEQPVEYEDTGSSFWNLFTKYFWLR